MRKDGTKLWRTIVITALHNEGDEIIGFSKVTRDLTERKLAEDRMRQYTAELESQNKELEQFAYVASHDLQEPLRKIQTFTKVIQRNMHDENRVKTVPTTPWEARVCWHRNQFSDMQKNC